jgi:hypothetical protein
MPKINYSDQGEKSDRLINHSCIIKPVDWSIPGRVKRGVIDFTN